MRCVKFPDSVFRVGRADAPLKFSAIRPDDAIMADAGNRYDVAGGQVLYAASSLEACFGETAARLRPTPRMRTLLADEEGFVLCGGIPRSWRSRRRIVEISAADPLPFVDVDDPDTLAHLSVGLASTLTAFGYVDNLDLSTLRNQDRRLSRAIALWAYAAVDEQDEFLYGGVRYASRISDQWENWAIFDGTAVQETSRRVIEKNDPDLRRVASMWDLVVH